MNKLTFNLRSGLLFPFQFQLVGYIFLFAGLVLLVINVWASLFLIILGFLIVTAYSGLEFNDNQFREYNAFFFIKSGKWVPYNEVEKIFIKKAKISQKFYGRVNQGSMITKEIYKAFIKFDNGKSILLFENKNQDKLKAKLQKLSNQFSVEIFDYT
ncbi:MAG TPA: hypothetical protein VFM92_15760 [Marivirga sp.]|nr:hypothetical protein [Marivirga sp.]